MSDLAQFRDVGDMRQALELTRLFVANALGPKPRRVRDQDATVERACQRLEASLSPEAGQARYILAVEYAAQSETQWARNASRRIEGRDWRLAVQIVRGLSEEDLRHYARGGLSIRATLGGWLKEAK